MPRPQIAPAAAWVSLALLCSAVSPPALHAALAATAGVLFETAPFVLAAELLAGRSWARIIPALGCGCTRRGIPGALSLPAGAVAWLAFGPAVALCRFCAGAIVAALAVRRADALTTVRSCDRPDAFAELAAIAPAALAAALAAQGLAALPQPAPSSWHAAAFAFAAGVAVGVLAPCATAAVAIAASLAHALPPAAAGILCSAGFLAWPRVERPAAARRGTGFASTLLALALGALALRGPSGLVNPRLLACSAVAALVAAAGLRDRTTRVRWPALFPSAMLAALAAGSPEPPYRSDATSLADDFPGERLNFTGVSSTVRGATTLERFSITCCRLDATAVAVRLTSPLAVPNGSWVAVSGTLVRVPDGSLQLRPARARSVPAPPDPYLYR